MKIASFLFLSVSALLFTNISGFLKKNWGDFIKNNLLYLFFHLHGGSAAWNDGAASAEGTERTASHGRRFSKLTASIKNKKRKPRYICF